MAHHTFGNTYQYYAAVTEADYSRGTLKNVIAKYFNNSYLGVISSLVKEEEISVEELKELIESINNGKLTIDIKGEFFHSFIFNFIFNVGTFLVFIMKSTCCLAVFYLFYRLLLSRDTFHRFNRMALLSVIVFSIAIPFIRLVTDEPPLYKVRCRISNGCCKWPELLWRKRVASRFGWRSCLSSMPADVSFLQGGSSIPSARSCV